MASRSDRRSRRATGQQRTPADPSALLLGSAMDSKLAETRDRTENTAADVSILQLLGGIPSPARKYPQSGQLQGSGHLGSTQPQGIPCCPPPHAPMPLEAPASPPPPPMSQVSVLNCDVGPSYRERLRAGGQGAFQRAFNVGLMPKSMKNDWSGPCASAEAQGMLPQQADMQNGMYQQWTGRDSQQMWNGAGQMQGHEYWYVPMEQPQVYTQSPEMVQMAPMQDQQQMLAMQPQALLQPPQISPTSMGNETLLQQESMPSELGRCLAIVMPESAMLPCDKDLVAAQLKAAADCQCYED